MIIYFTGTGNSRLVAERLHECYHPDDKQRNKLYCLEGDRLLHPGRQLLETADGSLVIWVFPVYSWGVPPVVLRFIDKVRFKGAEKARHYMVCTCGDDVGRTDDQWRHHIGRRGWTPRGAFSVTMPNTYVCMKGFDVDSPDIEAGKLVAMPGRVEEIRRAIDRGFSDSDLIRGSWAWWKTNLVYGLFRAFKMSPLPFRADPERCTSCGLCARQCPMLNIKLKDRRPQWGPACAMCLRCYHHCPVKAIAYGKETDGKGQYKLPADF
ncbi:MAG: EFR1 family ferrodoxin [Muribaculaceae bacterium]|jgi:NAD-dependent dihydropyrimidine dehydrogenase PreA subunit